MEYRIEQLDGGSAHVALAGAINEDAELSLQAITKELKDSKAAVFNFAQVTTINSLGVRAWVQFLRVVEEGRKIAFEECTPDVIMQINMIPNFQDKAEIISFTTNYICGSCNTTQKILITTKDLPSKTMPAPQKCPSCSEDMETEELEDEYFAFLLR